MIQNVFSIAMGAIVAFSATGVGVYWFLNSLFSIAQSYIIHCLILHRRKTTGSKTASRLAALGIT
jgi:YidC/Oxa1 family membrane protein insertase